ncbi:unnamed protein product [Urochloa humidicola]
MDLQAELRRPAAAHEAALRAVQKPPAKPWRGAAPPPPPPKVYRVEPREFRDLVQRLTGAPATAARGGGLARPQHHQATTAVQQPVPVRPSGDQQQHQQQLYSSPWFSFPLAGVDGVNGGLM